MTEEDRPDTSTTRGPETGGSAGEAEQPPENDGEAEVRQRLEEEIKKVRVEDVILQSVVSILNLTARRIAKEDERDLEQGRVGIEACRALVEQLPEEPAKQVREALTELQLLYAKEAGGASEEAGDEAPSDSP
jgi:hypothetical protein